MLIDNMEIAGNVLLEYHGNAEQVVIPAVVREFNAFGLWRAHMAWFAGFREPDAVAAVLLKKENRGEAP